MMMWDEAPESLEDFERNDVLETHYDFDIKASTTERLHTFLDNHFRGYKKSVFIREPLQRFPSALAQDCFNSEWPVKKTTFDVFESFERKIEEFEKSPSWESLLKIMGVGSDNDNHVAPQTNICNFEVLPMDIVYFDVDANLKYNYFHWLYNKEPIKDIDKILSKESNWVNSSNRHPEKTHIKKCVQRYIDDPNSNLVSWIKEAYSKDFDMYKEFKSLCYREGEKHGR